MGERRKMFKNFLARLFSKPPSKEEVRKAEKEMDTYMRKAGGRRLNPLYRPRRGRVKDDMEPGDIKTVGRVYEVK